MTSSLKMALGALLACGLLVILQEGAIALFLLLAPWLIVYRYLGDFRGAWAWSFMIVLTAAAITLLTRCLWDAQGGRAGNDEPLQVALLTSVFLVSTCALAATARRLSREREESR
jgi:hypothetical protein